MAKIPEKLLQAWKAVRQTQFENDKLYKEYITERDKFLGATAQDPLEQTRLVTMLISEDRDDK